VRKQDIKSGWLLGIGAVNDVTLGIFDLKSRRYVKRTFRADHELVSITGNVARLGRDPILHIHALIADRRFRTFGGHLFSARCCVTVEVMLQPGTARLRRRPDPETGLNLLAF